MAERIELNFSGKCPCGSGKAYRDCKTDLVALMVRSADRIRKLDLDKNYAFFYDRHSDCSLLMGYYGNDKHILAAWKERPAFDEILGAYQAAALERQEVEDFLGSLNVPHSGKISSGVASQCSEIREKAMGMEYVDAMSYIGSRCASCAAPAPLRQEIYRLLGEIEEDVIGKFMWEREKKERKSI